MIKWELFCNISATSWCEHTAPSKLFLTRHLHMNNSISCSPLLLQYLNWDLHTTGIFMRIKSSGLNWLINKTFMKITVKQTSHLHFLTLYRGRVIYYYVCVYIYRHIYVCVYIDYLVLTRQAKLRQGHISPWIKHLQEGMRPCRNQPQHFIKSPPTCKGCFAAWWPTFPMRCTIINTVVIRDTEFQGFIWQHK